MKTTVDVHAFQRINPDVFGGAWPSASIAITKMSTFTQENSTYTNIISLNQLIWLSPFTLVKSCQ